MRDHTHTRSATRNRRLALIALLLLSSLLIWQQSRTAVSADRSAAAELADARERVLARNSYSYTSDITQTTIPEATLENLGNTSSEERLYLVGSTNLSEQEMHMTLRSDAWQDGGSVLIPHSGIEIEMVDGVTRARQEQGQWEALDGFTDAFAPQGDFMSFLVASAEVTVHTPESRNGIDFTRYTFEVDGEAFADYSRAQMQATMHDSGELPRNAFLQASPTYAGMIGEGELWIGSDGLPIRQVLDLRFPAANGERVVAHIKTDFSDYGEAAAGFALNSAEIRQLFSSLEIPAIQLTTGILFVGTLFFFGRTRKVERGIAWVLVASMVLTPLLQIFTPTGTAHAQAPLEDFEISGEIAEQQQLDRFEEELKEQSFDPLADPLAPSAPSPLDAPFEIADDGTPLSLADGLAIENSRAPTDSDTDGLTDAFELEIGTLIDLEDTDDDGLDDFQEISLGTNPRTGDTDGDTLSDKEEIVGYSFNGRIWRLDPNQADSNGDGLTDAQELGPDANNDGIPDSLYDRNGDLTPDIFDDDNDGDKVPDKIDASPIMRLGDVTPFSRSNPFELSVNNLIANREASVEIQLRPTDPEHLWYAFNVLDWPLDRAGQVQDWDGGTFADNAADGITPPESHSHGDMRLTPMLEVFIPDNGNPNVPSAATIHAYTQTLLTAAATMNDITSNSLVTGTLTGKAIYVPLSLVSDGDTGERVAFSARLPLMTAESWGMDYEMRVVWVVQMLMDSCEKRFESGPNKGDCEIYGARNQPAPLHTYDETFEITGLNIREDVSAKSAIVFEDPTVDVNLNDDAALWALADNLDSTFMAARVDSNGDLDITVDEIARRFDHRTNTDGSNDPTLDQRWDIPNYLAADAGVDLEFTTLAEAAANMTMTRTHTMLATHFNSHWQSSPLMPTLLYASENTYRGVSLDELDSGGSHTSLNGAGDKLTVDFAPSGVEQLPTTANSLKWATYCGSTGTTAEQPVVWVDCATDVVWDQLDLRYKAEIDASASSPDVALGELTLLKLYWTGLAKGVSSVVYSNGRPQNAGSNITDQTLKTGLALGASQVANKIAGRFQFKEDAMKTLGRVWHSKVFAKNRITATSQITKISSKITSLWSKDPGISKWTKAKNAAQVIVLVAAVALFTVAQVLWPSHPATKMATKLVAIAASVALGVIAPIMSIINWSTTLITTAANAGQTLSRTAALRQVMSGSSGLLANTKLANMIGAAIVIAIAWGFFIASIVSNGIEFGSAEFNRGAASMIATSMVIYALALLASNPYGLVAVAILTLVDAVLLIVCAINDTDDCTTVTGEVTKFIAQQVYSYDLMIEIDASKNPNLRTYGAPELELTHPISGFVNNAPFSLALPVTTSIKSREPQSEDWKIAIYQAYFNESNFKSATFIYAMNDALGDSNPSLNADRDDDPGAWQGVYSHDNYLLASLYTGHKFDKPTIAEITRPAGINAPFDYNFNSAYAIPAYECWLVPNPYSLLIPTPLCYVRTKEGSDSSFTKGPVRDLFPATLDGFMAVSATGKGGYRLAWDSGFPTIYDADGDGLVTSELVSGGDPNDALWDSDYDGVSDFVELKQRGNGVGFSPIICDSDNDGLTDKQELELGTHPLRKDTDNDGLEDGEEVYHAVYVCQIGGVATHTPGHYNGGMEMRVAPHGELLTDTTPSAETQYVTISSDPTERDADLDSIPDSTEFLLNEKGERDKNGHPYNPNVANVPPLSIFTTLETTGGFAKPGQILAYTATVGSDTDFQPGVLEVREPAALGDGIAATYALPSLTANTSSTVNTVFTVAPAATSGPVTVTGIASARPTPIGTLPLWEWVNPNPVSVNASLDNRGVNNTWVDPSATNAYMFSTLIDSGPDADGDRRGEIRSVHAPSGAAKALSNGVDTTARSQAAPGIACNDDGRCLNVWDEKDECATIELKSMYVGEDKEGDGHYGVEPQVTLEQSSSVNAPSGSYSWMWKWWWTYSGDAMREGTDWPLTAYNSSSTPTYYYCQDQNDTGPWIKVYEDDGPDPGNIQHSSAYRITPEVQDEVTWDIGGPHGLKLTFDVNDVQRNRVKGRFVNAAGSLLSPTTSSLLDLFDDSTNPNSTVLGDFFPTVATDGENFLVAWNTKGLNLSYTAPNLYFDVTVTSYIGTQLLDANGTPIGVRQYYSAKSHSYDDYDLDLKTMRETGFAKTEADLMPSVIWAGDRYIVAYTHSGSNPGKFNLESLEVSASTGAHVSGSHELITDDVESLQVNRLKAPQLAYNPSTDQVIYVYTRATDNNMAVRLYNPGGSAVGAEFVPASNNSIYPDSPSIAYYPPTEGWMMSWAKMSTYAFNLSSNGVGVLDFAALNANGSLLMYGPQTPNITNQYGTTRPLSCAAPTSEPLAVYDFEELPDATNYTYSSDVGVLPTVYCTIGTCPVAGVEGAGDVVAPYSDRSVYFDGVDDALHYSSSSGSSEIGRIDDNFSVAFWMKTDGSTSGSTMLNSHAIFRTWNGTSGVGVSVGSGGLLRIGVGTQHASPGGAVVGDGEWHHVVLTRKASNGYTTAYVDGTAQGTYAFASNTILQNGFTLGDYSGSSLPYKGWLDDLQIYEGVLSAETVTHLYDRTKSTACVVSAAASNAAPTYQIGLERQDPRGDAQPIVQTASTGVVIDGDAPVSTLEAITTTARSRAAETRYVKVPAGGSVTQIIGGSSDDNGGSGVDYVNVTVNGGSPEQANGTANWVYALQLSEGVHNVAVAATDALGNTESPGATITIIGDATPPAIDYYDGLPSQLNAPRDSDGNYIVALSANVTDAGSGVQGSAVDFKLTDADGTSYGWQTAFTGIPDTDQDLYSYIEYSLPSGLGDPTGVYTVTARVIDGVGNSAEYENTLSLALPSFEVSVSAEDAALRVVTDTNIIINGLVTSTQTISSVEATFVPIEQLAVLSGTVVSLDLSNPDNDAWAEDTTDNGNNASCSTTCPYTIASRMAGSSGTYFDGNNAFFIPHSEELSTANDRSFAVQAWVKTTTTGDDIFSKLESGTGNQSGIEMRIRSNGMLELRKYSDTIVQATSGVITDDQWHLVTANIDRVNNLNQIYVDGVLVGEKSGLYAMTNTAPIMVGGQDANPHGFVGYMDEFTVWNRALNADEVAATFAMRNPNWQAAQITRRANRAGLGESAEWQIPIPDNTEGFHRIDVRITDDDGNHYRAASDWQTIIDTLAPRVTINEAFPTGNTYDASGSGNQVYDIQYSITAEDLHLSESAFDSVCDATTIGDRGYVTDDDVSWPDQLFPDVTWRDSLGFGCHVWISQANPTINANVCDIYGNCSPTATFVDTSGVPTGQTAPVIVSPASGQVVDGSNLRRSVGRDGRATVAMDVHIIAEHPTAMQSLEVYYNGNNLVKTIDFTQASNTTYYNQVVSIDLPGENTYNLSVVKTNWDSSSENSPAHSFTLDTERPSGTINVDDLTEADTLAVGSGILRFSGLVVDTMDLATVQLSVNGGPFEDVTLNGNESWHGAIYVGDDIYEESISVTVRFIDKAGAIGSITETIYVAIEEPTFAAPTAIQTQGATVQPVVTVWLTLLLALSLVVVTGWFRPKKSN